MRRIIAAKELIDHVISDAERVRLDQPTDPDKDAADRRPPHPVNAQARKIVFGRVDGAGEQKTEAAGEQARKHGPEKRRAGKCGVRDGWKNRAWAEEMWAL